jgi:hypothetical protein
MIGRLLLALLRSFYRRFPICGGCCLQHRRFLSGFQFPCLRKSVSLRFCAKVKNGFDGAYGCFVFSKIAGDAVDESIRLRAARRVFSRLCELPSFLCGVSRGKSAIKSI